MKTTKHQLRQVIVGFLKESDYQTCTDDTCEIPIEKVKHGSPEHTAMLKDIAKMISFLIGETGATEKDAKSEAGWNDQDPLFKDSKGKPFNWKNYLPQK
jgi:hypothetical protein